MKYKSTLFDEARNKIGSVVASKNAYGNYFRNHVIPHNPRTVNQVFIRGNFTTNSQAWKALTDTERAGWTVLAKQLNYTDQLGNKYHPTGQQTFVGCNGNLITLGDSTITTAPGTPDTPAPLSEVIVIGTVLTASPHTQVLTATLAGGISGQKAIIYATAQFSAGRSFVGRSQYRVIDTAALPAGGDVDLISLYNGMFGDLTVGSKLSIVVKAVSASGLASAEVRSDTIITAA